MYIEVSKLSEIQKAVIHLRFIDKIKIKEIARCLNVSPERLKQIQNKACKRLSISPAILKTLSAQEIKSLTQETKLIKDIRAEEQEWNKRVKEKCEKQWYLWQTSVTQQEKDLLVNWFSKKSSYLFKKEHSISIGEIQNILNKINKLLEVDQEPCGYSLEALAWYHQNPSRKLV